MSRERIALVAYQNRDIRPPDETLMAFLPPGDTTDREWRLRWLALASAYCRMATERSVVEGLKCISCGKMLERGGRRFVCSDSCEARERYGRTGARVNECKEAA